MAVFVVSNSCDNFSNSALSLTITYYDILIKSQFFTRYINTLGFSKNMSREVKN